MRYARSSEASPTLKWDASQASSFMRTRLRRPSATDVVPTGGTKNS
jgi:hypothetical protein